MNMRLLFAALGAAGTCFMPSGAASLADSAQYTLAIDTMGTAYAVTSVAAPVSLTYRAGDTVTVISPSGEESTLVNAAGSAGAYDWTALAGGVYTLANSGENARVTFSVRYSLFGTQGAGTDADPAKIVDGDELADLFDSGVAGDGYVFTLHGPAFVTCPIKRIPGCAILSGIDGLCRLVVPSDGLLYAQTVALPRLDTRQTGPDRRVDSAEDLLPFAYSGDNWKGDEAAGSTLTFTPASGIATVTNLLGTGTCEFGAMRSGDWTVALDSSLTNLTARISFKKGFLVIFH